MLLLFMELKHTPYMLCILSPSINLSGFTLFPRFISKRVFFCLAFIAAGLH